MSFNKQSRTASPAAPSQTSVSMEDVPLKLGGSYRAAGLHAEEWVPQHAPAVQSRICHSIDGVPCDVSWPHGVGRGALPGIEDGPFNGICMQGLEILYAQLLWRSEMLAEGAPNQLRIQDLQPLHVDAIEGAVFDVRKGLGFRVP